MSGTLGSIYDDPVDGGPRGPDLRWRVTVPASAVGDPNGTDVRVPARLETDDGVVVSRAINPADPPECIRIQVPDDAEPPFVLRLRGAGGVAAGVAPGDLYLHVDIGGSPAVAVNRSLVTVGSLVGLAVLAVLAAIAATCG